MYIAWAFFSKLNFVIYYCGRNKKTVIVLDPALDGVNQWPMISEGEASARTEFVYNIDEVTQRSALR